MTRPGHYWFTCPTCGRVVYMEAEPFLFQVIVEGDAKAAHRGGIGGVSINVEIKQ